LHSDSAAPSRHLVTYRDGEPIFRQGEPGDEMYIIQDGRVEIVLEVEGGEVVPLATLERGDFFGEMAVLEGEPRTATARSKGGCRVLPLRGALFIEMLQRDPETTLRMMRKLCTRIRELQSRVSEQDQEDSRILFIGEAAPARAPRATVPGTLGARLVHPSGTVLTLPDVAEARVGRPDPVVGSVPEVDLAALENASTVSRSHARILHREGKLLVVAEPGATNGTFVNGERLEPGVPRALGAGDSLAFGKVALELQLD
jgi:CRP-like cAMP-binding protein